jgi:hypothetical protein
MNKTQKYKYMPNLAALLLFVFTLPAAANEGSFADCTKLTNNDLRLDCYDKSIGYSPPSQATEPSVWVYEEKYDAFTDKNISRIYLSKEPYSSSGTAAPEFLFVRCNGIGNYDVFVTTEGYIGGSGAAVRYRFDGKKAVPMLWSLSTDGTSVFLKRTGQTNGFETHLKTGKDLLFEIRDYNGTRHSAKFINSKDTKLDFILNGCKS